MRAGGPGVTQSEHSDQITDTLTKSIFLLHETGSSSLSPQTARAPVCPTLHPQSEQRTRTEQQNLIYLEEIGESLISELQTNT